MKKKFILCSVVTLLFSITLISCGNNSDLTSEKTESKEITNDTDQNNINNASKDSSESNISDVSKDADANKSEDNINSKSSNDTVKTDSNPPANSPLDTSNTDAAEIFYGKWIISKNIPTSKPSTYLQEDIDAMIGKTIIFSKDQANYLGDQIDSLNEVIKNPTYKKKNLSNSDLFTYYKISNNILGINSDSVTEVTISSDSGINGHFFIKDNNTLILSGGGILLELRKYSV